MSTGTRVPSGAVAHSRLATYCDRSTFGAGVCLSSRRDAGVEVVLVDRRRCGERLVHVAERGRRPLRVAVELELVRFVLIGSRAGVDHRDRAVAPQHADALLGLGPLVDHEVRRRTARCVVIRWPGTWGTSSVQAPGSSSGAVITRKSSASRLVSTTKRSPQWSTPYSSPSTPAAHRRGARPSDRRPARATPRSSACWPRRSTIHSPLRLQLDAEEEPLVVLLVAPARRRPAACRGGGATPGTAASASSGMT